MVKMTLLSLLGDGQPAFAIGTGAKTGSLGVSFALPAKGEKKGASAPRKARASSGVAVPDKPLGLVSSPATPHSNCRSTPNTSSCPLPALSTLHLCGEMEGEVTQHRCVCDLGARSSPAGSQDIAACSPSRGGCAQSRHPHTSTKSPLCTNGCQKNKKPGNGANRGSGRGAQPCLGLPGSHPPCAAAASEAGGLRAPSCGCSGDAGAQPLLSGSAWFFTRSWGCSRWFPCHREATAGSGSPRASECSRLEGCSGEELRACPVPLPSPKLLLMGRGGGDGRLWVRSVRLAAKESLCHRAPQAEVFVARVHFCSQV